MAEAGEDVLDWGQSFIRKRTIWSGKHSETGHTLQEKGHIRQEKEHSSQEKGQHLQEKGQNLQEEGQNLQEKGHILRDADVLFSKVPGSQFEDKLTSANIVWMIVSDKDRFLTQRIFDESMKKLPFDLKYTDWRAGEVPAKEAVGEADFLIFVFSKEMAQRKFSLEKWTRLEKSIETFKSRCLLVTLPGSEGIPEFKIFQEMPKLHLNINVVERCLAEIADFIGRSHTVPRGVSLTNVGEALAWDYYCSYLKVILPDLPALIAESRIFNQNSERTSFTVFVLLTSDEQWKSIEQLDKRISRVQYLTKEEDVCGIRRRYTPALYRLRTDQGGDYFCCIDLPVNFTSLLEAYEEHCMSKTDLDFELRKFNLTLVEILEHTSNPDFNERVKLIHCNGNNKPLSHILVNLMQPTSTYRESSLVRCTPRRKFPAKDVPRVTALYSDISSRTMEFLSLTIHESVPIVHPLEIPTEMEDLSLAEKLLHALEGTEMLILILTKTDMINELFTFQILEHLSRRDFDMILVLDNVGTIDIPNVMKWTAYVTVENDDLTDLTCIQSWLQNEAPSKSHLLLPSDMIETLSSDFLQNYLHHLLPDLQRNIEAKLEEQRRYVNNFRWSDKLLLFLPKSGQYSNQLIKESTERYIIEYAGRVATIRPEAGNRVYFVCLFKITEKTQGSIYFFAGEYALPLLTLITLLEEEFVHYGKEEFTRDAQKLNECLGFLLKNDDACAEKVKLITYDDSTQRLPEVIIQAINSS